MKNQKNNYVGIGIVVLVLLIGFGGYYLKNKNKLSPVVTPTTSQESTDDLVNWNTYNSELFTIKYPKTTDKIEGFWRYDEVNIGETADTRVGFGPGSSKEGGYIFGVNVYTGKTVEELIKSFGQQFSDRKENRKDIMVNGKSALLVTVTTNERSNWISKTVVVEQDGTIYVISDGASGIAEFESFYNSFKINASDLGTSSWTTYTNKTFGYSLKFPTTYQVPPQTEKQKSQIGVDNNIAVEKKSDPGSSVIIVDVYPNKDNATLADYVSKNLKLLGVTGPLVAYNFNGYDSLFNKNQPGTNVFVKQGQYIYHITASTASSDKEVGDIMATFTFLPAVSYGPEKSATVFVKDGSSYGPPFDPNLYQLEISKGNNLFAKSDLVDLKEYLGKTITVNYREVIGVIMGEQQLVTVDSIE